MNNFYFKFLFLLTSLVIVTSSFAEEFGSNPEELLLKFENNCVQSKSIDKSVCDDLLRQLNGVISKSENPSKAALSSEDGAPYCHRIPAATSSINDLAGLTSEVEDASLKMSCDKKDQKEVASSCQEDLLCNLGRSVATAVDKVAPSFIARRVRKSLGSTASALGAGKKCLDSEGSDCLTEVVSSFVANIVGTLHTLKDVAKTAIKSIWGLKDYLFKKSDDLHTAANSTTSEISLFIKSPGDYIVKKFLKAKNAIDSWIKKEVFCQKWKGTPHQGTCVEPLESYSCLNCNDGLNAFCAGAGVFASETFIAFTTAGTLTAANIAMKAGVRLGAVAASKAAARIVAKVPALGRIGKVKKRAKLAQLARKSAKVSMATLHKMGEAIHLYKQRIGKMAVTKHFVAAATKVERAIDMATIPLRIFDDVAESAMKRVVARGAAKQGEDRLSQFVRAAARYERVKMADIIRRGESITSNTRELATARGVRRVWGHNDGNHFGGRSSRPEYDSPWDASNHRNSSNRNQGPDGKPSRNGDSRNRPTDSSASQSSQGQRSSNDRDRRSADSNHGDSKSNSESGNGNLSARSPHRRRRSRVGLAKATRYGVAADLVEKVKRGFGSDDGVNPADLVSDQAAASIIQQGSSSDSAMGDSGLGEISREAIEQRTGRQFGTTQEAQDFAQAMNSQYSDESNRPKIINSFKDLGYNDSEAEHLYNSEKNFYKHDFSQSSDSYADTAAPGANRIGKIVSPSATPSSLFPKMARAHKLVADIKKQIKDLENEAKSKGDGKGESGVSQVPTSEFTPNAVTSDNSYSASSPSIGINSGFSQGSNIDTSVASTSRVATAINPTLSDKKKLQKKKSAASKISSITAKSEMKTKSVAKMDYLDLYLKLAEVAELNRDKEGLGFTEATKEDILLTKEHMDAHDFWVLNIHVKNKNYKIFKNKKTGVSVAFKVRTDGLDFLADFPKDLI